MSSWVRAVTGHLRCPRADQLGAQALQPGSDAALHRALRLVQQVRDLTVGVAAEVGQGDGLALDVGELVERLLDVLGHGEVDAPRARGRSPPRRCGGASRSSRSAPGRLGPQQVDRAAVALGEQVGAQRAPLGVELLGLVPDAEEHLLHDLLGEGRVDEQALGQREHGAGVAPVGLGEGVLAVAADGDDEDGVAALGEVFG